jgi:hypothetical protein
MRKSVFSVLVVLVIVMVSCAKRGTITGGWKDTLAPVLKNSLPKNGATNFNGKEIKLYFDEYVKLKNVGKQLIVSPPMKNKPEILPYNASKFITIKLKDTLQPNTTYSFNFGQSIEDNNENNVLNQFKYVFSTGNYIDSLTIGAKLKDALDLKAPTFVSVMLYEVNQNYNDSTIYKEMPRYITHSLDGISGAKLENLKAGKYRLIALQDKNSNNKFDPKTDKIGYSNDFITVPNDTLFELELFQEEPAFKVYKPSQVSGNRMVIGYEGNAKGVEVDVKKNGNFVPFTVTQFPKKDSLQVWFPSMKNDSLTVTVTNKTSKSNFLVKIKEQKKDTLAFSASASDLSFRKNYKIHSDIPIVSIDKSKIRLLRKDSTAVKFTTRYDDFNQDVIFDFEKQPLEKFQMTVFPGALTDFYEKKNDTLRFSFSTRSTSDYGNLRVPLENIKRYPLIVELTDDKGVVIEREIIEKGNQVNFDLIEPKKYTLRVIFDDNKNGVWDPGNYMEKRQSEEVIYFPKELDVRANWDVEQPFDLQSAK